MRNTRLEVNLDNFKYNVEQIKKYTNKEIMPVIKANAYGTYINKRMEIIKEFDIVAVALVTEGIELRKKGYEGNIFILNQPSISDIDDIIKYNLTIGISDFSFLNECIKREASFKVHLEIETGMNRTGIQIEDLNRFLDTNIKSSLKIEGIYSHFSSADYNNEYTEQQITVFKEALDICRERGINFKYIHISASNGLLNYNLDFTNLVRPGLLLYGYESYKDCSKKIPLKPVCKLISEVTFIKRVQEGSKIGYDGSYTCDIDSSIATVPIGYADGIRRALSNKGYVYINNRKAPIVGKICMDSFMIDTTGIRVNVGDEVVIFDDEHITLDEVANLCNTISYEILCNISNRVTRVFIKKK